VGKKKKKFKYSEKGGKNGKRKGVEKKEGKIGGREEGREKDERWRRMRSRDKRSKR
jgi:hypothetical protein